MSHTLLIIPTSVAVGLTSVSLGLFRALDTQGVAVGFLKPIAQPRAGDTGPERSTHYLKTTSKITPPTPIDIKHAEKLLSIGRRDELMEEIVAKYEESSQNMDVVIVEGLVPTREQPYATRLNTALAKALDAEIIFVAIPGSDDAESLAERLEISARAYGGIQNPKVLGAIINKINRPDQTQHALSFINNDKQQRPDRTEIVAQCSIFQQPDFRLFGAIPWQDNLVSPRAIDICNFLNAKIINEGDINRRVMHVSLCARSMANMVDTLRSGSLIMTPGDRADIIVATCMAALSGIPIAALLLTGGYETNPAVMSLCKEAMQTGLPVISVDTDSYHTALSLTNINMEIPIDDQERIESMMTWAAKHIYLDKVTSICALEYQRRLSPPAFRHKLVDLARKANKRIVLPEGNEPRTIHAAAICERRRIAHCILLGDAEEINRIAQQNGIELPETIEIINPEQSREDYVPILVELRKHKGVTEVVAREQLKDNVMLGTLMLHQDQVDGLVSGAVHTTANTIRPALQLIKTAPNASLVSSIFFMCLPDQVLVYGDCAVNPDPNAEELADIAIQSAESARAFGIDPKVAMISYSTGSSGSGSDVEKVRAATDIAKQKVPQLLIDGPLQYDAALIEKVAKSKAPDSPVAGHATVIVFPDLNTGNTTYKAVQRSADVISIGPMLQGLRKPVNDLSRGALVEDIVFTIALTAIQASQAESNQS